MTPIYDEGLSLLAVLHPRYDGHFREAERRGYDHLALRALALTPVLFAPPVEEAEAVEHAVVFKACLIHRHFDGKPKVFWLHDHGPYEQLERLL